MQFTHYCKPNKQCTQQCTQYVQRGWANLFCSGWHQY